MTKKACLRKGVIMVTHTQNLTVMIAVPDIRFLEYLVFVTNDQN